MELRPWQKMVAVDVEQFRMRIRDVFPPVTGGGVEAEEALRNRENEGGEGWRQVVAWLVSGRSQGWRMVIGCGQARIRADRLVDMHYEAIRCSR